MRILFSPIIPRTTKTATCASTPAIAKTFFIAAITIFTAKIAPIVWRFNVANNVIFALTRKTVLFRRIFSSVQRVPTARFVLTVKVAKIVSGVGIYDINVIIF